MKKFVKTVTGPDRKIYLAVGAYVGTVATALYVAVK